MESHRGISTHLVSLEAFDVINPYDDSTASKTIGEALNKVAALYHDNFRWGFPRFMRHPKDLPSLNIESDYAYFIVAEEIDRFIDEANKYPGEYPKIDGQIIGLLNEVQEKVIQKEYGETSIEELMLPVRPYNCVKRFGIHTLADLMLMTKQKISKIVNVGEIASNQIEDSLEHRGLRLRLQ
jgi:hypothetical protein